MEMGLSCGEPKELNRMPLVALRGRERGFPLTAGGGRRFEEQSAGRTGKCSSFRGLFESYPD